MYWLALSDSFGYLCYGSTAVRNIFIPPERYTSETDVYRRQILMYKYGPPHWKG